jgi:hypothetical protein
VSLILEALKKLERDKQAPDRGFLVVAHVPWAGKAQGRKLWLGLLGALLVLAAGVAYWRLRSGAPATAPAVVVAPEATLAAPSMAPRALPSSAAALPAVSLAAPVRSPAPSGPAIPGPSTPSIVPRDEPLPSATTSPRSEEELRLNAISQQEGRWVAVLNDRLVREGDEFDGIRVVRIGETEVEVEIAGRRSVVRF